MADKFDSNCINVNDPLEYIQVNHTDKNENLLKLAKTDISEVI